jgi:hypothetical protein
MKNTLKNLNKEINYLLEETACLQTLKTLIEEKEINNFKDFQEMLKQIKVQFTLGLFSDKDILETLEGFSPIHFNKNDIRRTCLNQEIFIVKKFLDDSITANYNLVTGELEITIFCKCKIKSNNKFELNNPINFDYEKEILKIEREIKKIRINPFQTNKVNKIDKLHSQFLFLNQSKKEDEKKIKAKRLFQKQIKKAFRIRNVIEKYFILNKVTIEMVGSDSSSCQIIYKEEG